MQIVPSGGQVFRVTQEHEVVNQDAEGNSNLPIQTVEFCFTFEMAHFLPLLQQIYWERPDLAEADSLEGLLQFRCKLYRIGGGVLIQ